MSSCKVSVRAFSTCLSLTWLMSVSFGEISLAQPVLSQSLTDIISASSTESQFNWRPSNKIDFLLVMDDRFETEPQQQHVNGVLSIFLNSIKDLDWRLNRASISGACGWEQAADQASHAATNAESVDVFQTDSAAQDACKPHNWRRSDAQFAVLLVNDLNLDLSSGLENLLVENLQFPDVGPLSASSGFASTPETSPEITIAPKITPYRFFALGDRALDRKCSANESAGENFVRQLVDRTHGVIEGSCLKNDPLAGSWLQSVRAFMKKF